MPKYPGSYELWNQYVDSVNSVGLHVHEGAFEHFDLEAPRRGPNHPAHVVHLRPLVTYKSTNEDNKTCKYGTYRAGGPKGPVKCLRSGKHAPPGVSHKRGAYSTNNPIGRPKGPNTNAPQMPKARKKKRAAAAALPRKSARIAKYTNK